MSNIKLFESRKIRSAWDEEEEKYYFAISGCNCCLNRKSKPISVLARNEKAPKR
jgi:hypothetical protein